MHELLRELGRIIVEGTFNHLEPHDRRDMPNQMCFQGANRTPNLAGEDRRPTLEEREPEAAVHLLVKHIKGGGHWPLEPVSRIWIRRAATSASSSLRTK